ncbi:type IV pilus modification PilV family protein [Actinoplanes sp. URMC 104]|uniref:type IV pilus modification PilV family protein n=1 Tax=Actinoplanes sp. URMC 104 TaxID=3423409 RepID=UPI003F1C4B2C
MSTAVADRYIVTSKPRCDDEGFTLVEVIVSLALLTMVLTSLTVFMINSRKAQRYATLRDTAVQLAVDGMEKARGVRGSALLSGRAACDSGCSPVAAPVAGTLLAGAVRWDAAAAGTLTVPQPGTQPDGSVVDSPLDPEVVRLDGRWFKRYYHVGACSQPAVTTSTADISCGTTVTSASLVRLVVAVTWSDAQCEGGTCAYAEAGLFSSAVTDPFLGG